MIDEFLKTIFFMNYSIENIFLVMQTEQPLSFLGLFVNGEHRAQGVRCSDVSITHDQLFAAD